MSNDIYTKENFELFAQKFDPFSSYIKPIVADGSTSYYGDRNAIEINYSSILTRLIQEAGRYCEDFASDLFIDWKIIDDALLQGNIESETKLFGFRQYGVDHINFVFSQAHNSPRLYQYEYRSIWRLDIEVTTDENYWWHKVKKDVKMTLYRVRAPWGEDMINFFQELKAKAAEEVQQ